MAEESPRVNEWGPRDALYDENTRLRERVTELEAVIRALNLNLMSVQKFTGQVKTECEEQRERAEQAEELFRRTNTSLSESVIRASEDAQRAERAEAERDQLHEELAQLRQRRDAPPCPDDTCSCCAKTQHAWCEAWTQLCIERDRLCEELAEARCHKDRQMLRDCETIRYWSNKYNRLRANWESIQGATWQ